MSGPTLNLSANAYRQVLDALPVACWIYSGGVIQYTNQPLARLIGISDPAQIIGVHVLDLLDPASRPLLISRLERLLAGEEVAESVEGLIGREGGRIEVEVRNSVIKFNGEPMILSCFHDITQRRRVEAALRETDYRFRRLAEGNLIGIAEVDSKLVLDANDVFLAMVGRTREEMRRSQVNWREMTPPEYAPLNDEMMQKIEQTGECSPFEKEFIRPDGSRVPVLIGCSALEVHPQCRVICFVIDLTDRRRLQEMRAEKLRFESIGVLAAGMAHNLNNLLTGVIGSASLMFENRMLARDTPAGRIVEDIIDSGERAALLTAQLLAYAGQGRFVVGATDVREVIRVQIEHMRKSQIPEKIKLTVNLSDSLPLIIADPNQLRHVVLGLVMNAVEAVGNRDGGEIEISARVETAEVETVATRAGDALPAGQYCVVEVKDNGAGMDESTLARAFDPFFTTKFPGRGLGLAAIAGIVRASRGGIHASSSPGAGSVFQVYLPAARDD